MYNYTTVSLIVLKTGMECVFVQGAVITYGDDRISLKTWSPSLNVS